MVANSKLFFDCPAQIKENKIFGTTVHLQPLYCVNWKNDWPRVLNSNLLHIQKFDYKTPINKKLKLQINHTLSTENSSKSLEPSTSHKTESPVITKNIYNHKALNIDLLGICPSLHSCAQFTKSLARILTTKNTLTHAASSWSQIPVRAQGHRKLAKCSRRGRISRQISASYPSRSALISILHLQILRLVNVVQTVEQMWVQSEVCRVFQLGVYLLKSMQCMQQIHK